MAKYSALGKYLLTLNVNSITLSFAEIEEIIEAKLPASAFRHSAYWSNETDGTHTWAHVWQAAGWRSENLNQVEQSITFRRTQQLVEEQLARLEPSEIETIYDLLEILGISTADWNGNKANPKYCYNWSFGDEHEGYAVCLWHRSLTIEHGKIVRRNNLRQRAIELKAISKNVSLSSEKRNSAAKRAARAGALDDAIRLSFNHGLPVSVIVVQGIQKEIDIAGSETSEAESRSLDPIKWYVHSYDDDTGAFLLVRGVPPLDTLAASSAGLLDVEDYSGPPDVLQQRAIKARRGQKDFRERLLTAYGSTCAITGCRIVDILEAAHIRPHAEEPNYRTANGLLLRADIHTLFDLGLLTIDLQRKVCLAAVLLKSEYKNYQGRELRQPLKVSDMPDMDAIQRRYAEFMGKHGLK